MIDRRMVGLSGCFFQIPEIIVERIISLIGGEQLFGVTFTVGNIWTYVL